MKLKKKKFETITYSYEISVDEIHEILGCQSQRNYHDMVRYELEQKLLTDLSKENPHSDIRVIESTCNRIIKNKLSKKWNKIYITFEIKKECE